MKKIFDFALGAAVYLAGIALFSVPAMFLWNALLPGIFGLPAINYWQAAGRIGFLDSGIYSSTDGSA